MSISEKASHNKGLKTKKSFKTIRNQKFYFILLFLYLASISSTFASTLPIDHALTVSLKPSQSIGIFHDIVTIPGSTIQRIKSLQLNKNAKIKKIMLNGKQVTMDKSNNDTLKLDLQNFKKKSATPLRLVFDYTLPLQITNKKIEPFFISSADNFYPRPTKNGKNNFRVTFYIKVKTPKKLNVVSQGEKLTDFVRNGNRTVVWRENKPQEEIILIADHYQVFTARHQAISLYAYLLHNDKALAEKYFTATRSYIDLYSKLIAPYPYKKFALVENSKQTGYGMPSFTLLGSRIIRFPFILQTSYPHEVLHNWFGNGVYIRPDSGNWAEGLTTYLADHLLSEQRGTGGQYRLQELMKYSNYVTEKNDFSLKNFKGRDSMVSQAIGYGKSLMVFHMLRLEIGNTQFFKALRDFHNSNQFEYAGYKEIQTSFERVSKRSLGWFFNQWISRKGAPKIKLFTASESESGGNHLLKLGIRQIQSDPAFKFKLPIVVWLKGLESPSYKILDITKKEQASLISFPSKPLKVILDPYHEVFRRLNPEETPPNLGAAYGSEIQKTILPTDEISTETLNGYKEFSQSIKNTATAPNVIRKNDSFTKPLTKNLWVFGKNNPLSKTIKTQLNQYGIEFKRSGLTVNNINFQWENHSFVFTLDDYNSKDNQVTWIIADSKKSIPGLIRKLPHYGKYGYLVFKGDEPKNVAKGTWPSSNIGLSHTFEKGTYSLPSKASWIK